MTYLRRPQGSEHGLAKLNESQVREILYGRHANLSTRAAARIYNVSQSAIARIRSGRAWRHV